MSLVCIDKDIDSPPVEKVPAQVAFVYPIEMIRAGFSDDVLATATVEDEGRISHVVVGSTTSVEFHDAVIAGMRRCVFFPAKSRGLPVRSVIQCKVKFMLAGARNNFRFEVRH
jgi:outer membrane biosynthesis protein TonB